MSNSLALAVASFAALGVVLVVLRMLRSFRGDSRLLAVLHNVARIMVVFPLVVIVGGVWPAGPVGSWVIPVIAFILFGWSTRDLLLDLVAGIILLGERRIRRGMWVAGDEFQGTVERRTLLVTWLRDGQGHRLSVPNRAIVGTPVIYDAAGDTEREVAVRLQGYTNIPYVRKCLNDAILSSPWVLSGTVPVVLRDPADPMLWRVRAKLLEPRFAPQFEGELLERVEELLSLPHPTSVGTEDAVRLL